VLAIATCGPPGGVSRSAHASTSAGSVATVPSAWATVPLRSATVAQATAATGGFCPSRPRHRSDPTRLVYPPAVGGCRWLRWGSSVHKGGWAGVLPGGRHDVDVAPQDPPVRFGAGLGHHSEPTGGGSAPARRGSRTAPIVLAASWRPRP
jgi:hypothetical protein